MEPHSINRCGRNYSSFLFLYWKAGRAGTQRKYSAKPHSRNPPNVFRIIFILIRIGFGGFCHTQTFADRCQILQTEPRRPRFDAFAGEVCSFSGQLFRIFFITLTMPIRQCPDKPEAVILFCQIRNLPDHHCC